MMVSRTIFLLVLISVASGSEENYTIAVVEYHPNGDVTTNSENYMKIIDSENKNLDLIIFPESTLLHPKTFELATDLPENDKEDLCQSKDDKYQTYIKKIACTAEKFNTNVVVNLVERVKCEDCSLKNNGYDYFNTDAVFNRKGRLVAKYHKYNLFGESGITKPKSATPVKFALDSIEFGIFTCFDILFETPTLNLTRNLNVKNIIFPTMWFSELPFLTSLQTQQMWAYENNVYVFSAGALSAYSGSGGSGLYVGSKGALNYTFNSEDKISVVKHSFKKDDLLNNTQEDFDLLDEDVDKIASQMDNVNLRGSADFSDITTKTLDINQDEIITKLCHKEMCCNFHINLSKNSTEIRKDKKSYIYKLVAFSGLKSFLHSNAGVEICAVVACADESTCTKRFPKYSEVSWPITFNQINITADFDNVDSKIQFPNTLLSSIRPISPKFTSWQKEILENGKILRRSFILKKPVNRLFTFSIFGRDFSRDDKM